MNFKKSNGLVTAVIQHQLTKQVLMVGYMNEEALQKTREEKRVTFYSRTKERLWTKGESSGNFLTVKTIVEDCDNDALLILAIPEGPTCHKGTQSCFGTDAPTGFAYQLENIIENRKFSSPDASYVNRLFRKGVNKIAQKVGEEAVELVIEAKDSDDDKFLNEAADLLFHYLVLLNQKGFRLEDVEKILRGRHTDKTGQ